MTKTETFNSVWDALADTPEQAANLRARAELMRQIAAVVETNGWKQSQAAMHCGVTQPRIHDLLRGRISKFSLLIRPDDVCIDSFFCRSDALVAKSLADHHPSPRGRGSHKWKAFNFKLHRAGSIDALVNIATAIGRRVHMELEAL